MNAAAGLGDFDDMIAVAAARHRIPRRLVDELLALEPLFADRTAETDGHDLEVRIAEIACAFIDASADRREG